MNDIYSFYQLISKYQIEIPIIQRDYAQGRDNTKATDVRKSLVEKMKNVVENEKEALFFDFVYGRVDGSKFIPFDGQQRLTTLFLFHKYVFEKCQSSSDCSHKGNCICKDILGRFSYATRQSSREFCEQLVKNSIIPNDDYKKRLRKTFIDVLKDDDKKKEEKANEYIKPIIYRFVTNQSWFYSDWQKDPTVLGMLTMLDEIHCQMNNETDFKAFAERLTSGCNCPITFHFVDMGEHKMSDETYVKMNARGKMLTPFENFKASLEQYLEENSKSEELTDEIKAKHQELLRRLNGIYNEDLKKYTGIDGTWLDLFWGIKNKDKKENEEKELPDTLIMSFFNRHFMNVWRCWYAIKHKTEKEREKLSEGERNDQKEWDGFNERMSMPLFPTKDDFVSFDIYRFVMDKCGVEKCLTPIFNICDALCTEGNNIINDCQAVWNRDDSDDEKWDLFQKNVNNYKSRTAFYALLKYYENPKDGSKITLAQWMRIVWNIIENYVEREDSYIPALQLIENIAQNGFDITKLGDDYNGVAKDQVKEEIAKAEQILDKNDNLRQYNGVHKKEDGSNYRTWEEIIIDAEKYAFFKGAIRFLFTKENIEDDWEYFDTKWENAQKYFDKNGVKDGDELYKTNSLLMKSLLANGEWNNIWWWFEFSNDALRWKRILTSDNWKIAVDAIMSKKVSIETINTCVNNISNPFIKNIVDDRLMDYVCNEMSSARIRNTYHDYQAIWVSGNPANQIVLNPILSKLQSEGKISYRNSDNHDNTIPYCRYYKCFDKNVDFKFKNHFFQWYGTPNDNELDVYLMEEDNWNNYKKRHNPKIEGQPDNVNYYCFRVTPEMETNTSLFTDKLDCLIAQAYPDADKSICEKCKEKICEESIEQ